MRMTDPFRKRRVIATAFLLVLLTAGRHWSIELQEGSIAGVVSISAGGYIDSAEQIFFAYDESGNTNIGTSESDVTWDTEVREDSAYSHAADSAEIQITVAGTYLIRAEITADNTNAVDNRLHADWYLKLDPQGEGSWGEAKGTRTATYHRIGADGKDNAVIHMVAKLQANAKIKVCGISDHATDCDTVPNGCRIFIRKI